MYTTLYICRLIIYIYIEGISLYNNTIIDHYMYNRLPIIYFLHLFSNVFFISFIESIAIIFVWSVLYASEFEFADNLLKYIIDALRDYSNIKEQR